MTTIIWEDVKEILEPLLVSGEIPDSMPPRQVYAMPQYKDIFEKVKYENFASNFYNLRNKVRKWKTRSEFDEKAYDHDIALYPTDTSKLRWPGSEAEALLKQDVDDGKQKTMKPSQLRETQEAYMEWPLDRFRGHIYQEERKWIETPYWAGVRRQKKEKKDEARRKAAAKASKKESDMREAARHEAEQQSK
jgi:hypothetical protein